MFNIVLYQPEIPPNTGNIIRLCANTGCHLHLIEPLGFRLEDKQLRRAGLDYHEWADIRTWGSIDALLGDVPAGAAVYALTTKGRTPYHKAALKPGDYLLFGPETRGLPDDFITAQAAEKRLRLPMLPHSRSLNLSNTVAIVVYEALRQNGFGGGLV